MSHNASRYFSTPIKRVVCFGPGPQFKGGMANYNTSLAKAFDAQGIETHIVSWTQQYPAIIPRDFIDRKSRQDQLAGTNIRVHYVTNYNNPRTWAQTVRLVRELQPDAFIVQWSIALQGFPLGWILRRLRKVAPGVELIIDLHFVLQKEGSSLDRRASRYGLSPADSFLVHALKTARELEALFPKRRFVLTEQGPRSLEPNTTTVVKLYHPIYDMFRPDPAFDIAAAKREMGLRQHVFLFFGFIRKYKGLHNVLPAFAQLASRRNDVSLMVVGESFWQTLDTKKFSTRVKKALFGAAKSLFLKKADDEQNYNPLAMIDELGIRDRVFVMNEFVPNEDVHRYFQVADAIVLYYETATPSGVESISYNFELPALATRVGHFPETIQDGFNGYLAEPGNIDDMARQMERFIEQPLPRENVRKSSEFMSWANYAQAIARRG